MASEEVGAALRGIHRLFGPGTIAGLSEGQLLERFVGGRDEAAFEALVARHGPMVLGVCRHVLADSHAAEDAFQATFLVLVRKAGSIRRGEAVGPWLYRVARRVAIRASRDGASRDAKPIGDEASREGEPSGEAAQREWRAALNEEVDRLPAKYRAPVVLCYLEGLSHDEAAGTLRWPIGTVKGRLARARDLLRDRLTRRGLAVPSGAVALTIAAGADAAVSPALRDATVEAALAFAAGRVAAVAPAAAAGSLAKGMLRAMLMTKLKAAVATVLVAGLTIGAGAAAGHRAGVAEGADGDQPASADGKAAPRANEGAIGLPALAGTWDRVSMMLQNGEAARDRSPLSYGTILIRENYLWSGEQRPGEAPRMVVAVVDARRPPRKINLAPVGGTVVDGVSTTYLANQAKELRAIFRLEGDLLTLCVPVSPAADRPRDFEPPDEDVPTFLITYRRRTSSSIAEELRLDLELLKGDWVPSRRVSGGVALEVPDFGAEGPVMKFRGRSARFEFQGKLEFEVEVRLDPSRSPKTIDLRRIGAEPGTKVPRTSRGIYRLEGDRLTICTAAGDTEEADRPTGFESTPANGWIVAEYIRRDGAPARRDEITLAHLQGRWAAIDSEVMGQSHAIDRERGEGLWLTIRRNRAEFSGVNPPIAGRMIVALEPAQEPTAIDFRRADPKTMEPTGRTFRGIVRRRGDELTLCLAAKEDDARPGEFATKPGDGRSLIVFRKSEDEPGPPGVVGAKASESPDDPKAAMKTWSEARLKAARQRLDAQKAFYENGTITIDRYLDAARRLMEAQVAANGSAADRRAAIKAYVDLTAKIVEREKAKFEVGAGSVPNLAEAEEIRAEAEFRLAREQAEAKDAPKPEGREAEGKPTSRDRLIRSRLDIPADVEFREARLDLVLHHISDATKGPSLPDGLPIYLDPISLREKGLDSESKVTFIAKGLTLKTVLEQVLGQLGLTYTIRDGLVLIEGPSSAGRRGR